MKRKTKTPKYSIIVILFGEIWLKGRNRSSFIDLLYDNVKAKLRDEQYSSLERLRDRFVLALSEKSDIESITNRLKHVFGISWFSTAVTAENSIKEIVAKAALLAGDKEVRIIAHRSYKDTKFNSVDIVRGFIDHAEKKQISINKDSDNELHINVTRNYTIISDNKIKGLGGLPVGCSGKAIILLSGGIDSCIAAFYAMKRGLQPVYLLS